MLFKIAARNVLRNRRRSAVTVAAVAVGALALLVFGAFQSYIFTGFQTNVVEHVGHLTVFRDGFFLYGAGNPAEWGIDEHERVMRLIADDPVLKPMLRVVTPRQQLSGIASYVTAHGDAAKTFLGFGVVPSDRERMRQWDEYGVRTPYHPDGKLADDAPDRGAIGMGVARVLGVCGRGDLPPCVERPHPPATAPAGPDLPADLTALASEDAPTPTQAADALPRIDLLAATAGGAPNVVSLSVSGTELQGAKELDDVYVDMHLKLAQDLVYGRGEHKATSIVLQLNRTEDMPAARARLGGLFRANNLPLEVRDFVELTPFYGQTHSFFGALFLFIAIIMGVIVLFTVVNTMTMAVVERTAEIGATRALGLRRGAVRRQFVLEGWLLGVLGATLGLVLAWVVVVAVNRAGLTWTPPGNSSPVPFRLAMSGTGGLAFGIWAALVLVATLAALFPANRAARLKVVDALRHV
jgi:putative ABC transport system permease protein